MNNPNTILTALVWCCVAAVLVRELVGLAIWWRIIQNYRAPVQAHAAHAAQPRRPAPPASLPDDLPDDPLVIEQARRMMDPGTGIGC